MRFTWLSKGVLVGVAPLVILLFLLRTCNSADPCKPLPPDAYLRYAVVQGCTVDQAKPSDVHWYLRVWSRMADGTEWRTLYSVRQPEDLDKILMDCDRWLACVKEASRRVREEAPKLGPETR
ncbi:MAG: hypothetical protein ABH877_03420 [bacterium]